MSPHAGAYDMYHRGEAVRIAVPYDPFTGWVGTVASSRNHDGELVYHVEFNDGNNAYYTADELCQPRYETHRDRT